MNYEYTGITVYVNRKNIIRYIISNTCFINGLKRYIPCFLVCFLSISLCINSNTMASAASFPLRQGHAQSINTPKIRVDIFYYENFPYGQGDTSHETEGCVQIPESKTIRCKELLSLLRSESTINSWLSIQKEKGYLPLGQIKAFGNVGIKSYINKVIPIISPEIKPINKNIEPVKSNYTLVTGLSVRHALHVRQYTFRNLNTNTAFFVKATPEHPVYSVNRHTFIPISALSPKDHLLSSAGDKIQLICPQGIKNSCGTIVNKAKITRVYNIETNGRHTYFVQSEKLLVHNCGGWDKNTRFSHGVERDGIDSLEDHFSNELPKNKVRAVTYTEGEKIMWIEPNLWSMDALILQRKRMITGYMVLLKSSGRRLLGFMDSQGHIAPYSAITQLSLENGKLLRRTANGKMIKVQDTITSFNIKDELEAQYEAQLTAEKTLATGGKNVINKLIGVSVLGSIITGSIIMVGGLIAAIWATLHYHSS